MVDSADQVPVLMFHSVARHATARFREFVVEPAAFVDHVDALVDAGYEPVTVSDHVARPSIGDPRRVVLTFDDAFDDFHSTVLPVLAGLGVPATLYVPTGYVGGTSRWLGAEGEADRPTMSWGAVAEAASAGVEMGSHSVTHPQLDRVPRSRVRAEVRDSKRELEDRLQREVTTFAYPFGYHDATVRAEVREAGYRSACAVGDLASTTADPLVLHRWTVRHGLDPTDLLRLLERRNSPATVLRSAARASASRTMRRLGLKRRTPSGGAR